jgi:hypothetical protein
VKHAERRERRPFIALYDVSFQGGTVDMKKNSVFNLARKSVFVDGNRDLHRSEMVEFDTG